MNGETAPYRNGQIPLAMARNMNCQSTEIDRNTLALPTGKRWVSRPPYRQVQKRHQWVLSRIGVMTRAISGLAVMCLVVPMWLSDARAASEFDLRQVTSVFDLRSDHSDGSLSIETLSGLASRRGIDALFVTDHDRMVMEYGLFPLQHILRRREERHSINRGGATSYLNAITAAAEKFPEVILIPGAESAPYYYWSGSYVKGTLTAHDHERRLLAIGIEQPEAYRRLPVLHNAPTLKYAAPFVPQLVMFTAALCLGIVLVRNRGRTRRAGMVIVLLSALLMVNTKPFRSSPFDPYMGDLGIVPYQHYIDHVERLGAMTFWNYPETRSGVRPLGPIRVKTPPHPEVLEQSKRYTGFAAIYGDTITVTEPGREWDRVLEQYCRGVRNRPVWGISTADYHREEGAGEKLGNFITVILVREKTKEAILEAVRKGRMYATRGRFPQRPVMPLFAVTAEKTSARATMGQEIALPTAPIIRVEISSEIPSNHSITVRLIRSGQTIYTETGPPPMVIEFRDSAYPTGKKGYYRIEARSPDIGALISNPIFVTRN